MPDDDTPGPGPPRPDTALIGQILAGDMGACDPLWQRYFPRLVVAVRARLRGAPVALADEEDVALSGFKSFIRRAADGQFPWVQDADDLWRLLLTIAYRKTAELIRYEKQQKRDRRRLERAGPGPGRDPLAGVAEAGPGPDDVEEHAEQIARLFRLLGGGMLRDVAELKAEGHSNKEIALKLRVAVSTVERKLNRIRKVWEKEHGTG